MTFSNLIKKGIKRGYKEELIKWCSCLILLIGFESGFGQNDVVIDKNKLIEIKNYHYAIVQINDLKALILESDYLIRHWVNTSGESDTPKKLRLIDFHKNTISRKINAIDVLATNWNTEDLKSFDLIKISIDTVLMRQRDLMDKLKDYNDYHDVAIQFECESKIADPKLYSEITDRIILDLSILSDTFTVYFEEMYNGKY